MSLARFPSVEGDTISPSSQSVYERAVPLAIGVGIDFEIELGKSADE